jgi:hypothetical protein
MKQFEEILIRVMLVRRSLRISEFFRMKLDNFPTTTTTNQFENLFYFSIPLENRFKTTAEKEISLSCPRTPKRTSSIASSVRHHPKNQEEIQGYCVRKTCGN